MRVAGHIHQQVAKQPVDEPGFDDFFSGLVALVHLLEGDLQFVQAVVARFVDARRLAGRTDEHAGEQIRERRMVLPVSDQAAQQIGAPQQRAVGGRRTANGDVVAPASAGMAALTVSMLKG